MGSVPPCIRSTHPSGGAAAGGQLSPYSCSELVFVSIFAIVTGILQADFLNHAVEAILELYADTGNGGTHSVESVMIVGHSLGGVIAR